MNLAYELDPVRAARDGVAVVVQRILTPLGARRWLWWEEVRLKLTPSAHGFVEHPGAPEALCIIGTYLVAIVVDHGESARHLTVRVEVARGLVMSLTDLGAFPHLNAMTIIVSPEAERAARLSIVREDRVVVHSLETLGAVRCWQAVVRLPWLS